MDGGKLIMGLKIIVNYWTFGYGIRRNFPLILSSLLLSDMVVKFWSITSLESHGERQRKSKSVL